MEDLPFWLDLAAQAGGPLLELGCGTGRVLIPLAQAGYCTIGLDHDLSMLKYLQSNIGQQLQHVPQLFSSDIARFNLAAQFPLIILPCNTFSTLSDRDRRAGLSCAWKHLRKDGIFAVCLPNPELLMRLPSRSEVELEDEFIHPLTGNPVQVSSSWHRRKHTFNVTWIYDHLLPDGTVERLEVNTLHQLMLLKNYMDDIEVAGLKVREIYGDFDRSEYTSDSPYLILLISH
jgi:SAM-dependent methyltransferase